MKVAEYGLCMHCGAAINAADSCDVCGTTDADARLAFPGDQLYRQPHPVIIGEWVGEEEPMVLVVARSLEEDWAKLTSMRYVPQIDLGLGGSGIQWSTTRFDEALCFNRKMAYGVMDTYKGDYVALPHGLAARLNALANRSAYIRREMQIARERGCTVTVQEGNHQRPADLAPHSFVVISGDSLRQPGNFSWYHRDSRPFLLQAQFEPIVTETLVAAAVYDLEDARRLLYSHAFMTSDYHLIPTDLAVRIANMDALTTARVNAVKAGVEAKFQYCDVCEVRAADVETREGVTACANCHAAESEHEASQEEYSDE